MQYGIQQATRRSPIATNPHLGSGFEKVLHWTVLIQTTVPISHAIMQFMPEELPNVRVTREH